MTHLGFWVIEGLSPDRVGYCCSYQASTAHGRGTHEIALDGYAYRWFRVGAVDETLTRAPY
jgi:hypothetical protein